MRGRLGIPFVLFCHPSRRNSSKVILMTLKNGIADMVCCVFGLLGSRSEWCGGKHLNKAGQRARCYKGHDLTIV